MELMRRVSSNKTGKLFARTLSMDRFLYVCVNMLMAFIKQVSSRHASMAIALPLVQDGGRIIDCFGDG